MPDGSASPEEWVDTDRAADQLQRGRTGTVTALRDATTTARPTSLRCLPQRVRVSAWNGRHPTVYRLQRRGAAYVVISGAVSPCRAVKGDRRSGLPAAAR